MISPEIADLLVSEANRINSPAFIADDPVQFPRRFSKQQDIEICSLLVSSIAWGNRKMICRDANRLLEMMNNEPYEFTMAQAYEDLDPQRNVHRTFFVSNLQHFLRGLRQIYLNHNTLDDFCSASGCNASETPSWALAAAINQQMADANDGCGDCRCLPLNMQTTALKRLNMALRWLVRDDGIVDLGIWKSIPKSKLFIPLDVHVGNVSRQLGLLQRKANDRKSAIMLTETMRELRPDDPTLFDFALFGIGITNK